MIYSRPGFSTVVSDDKRKAKPAKINSDMQPAIARHSTAKVAPSKSPFVKSLNPAASEPPVAVDPAVLQAKADAAWERMRAEAEAASKTQVIVNPNPSATPVLTSPYPDPIQE
jgi:hypothetical protein